MLSLSSADFFQNQLFPKTSFRITIRESNSSDPDQDQHCVGPDLGPNCLQRLSAGKKKLPLKLKSLLARKEFTLTSSISAAFLYIF